jgi:hypothetical protein
MAKDITLQEAFDYLRLAEGVILEGRVLDISLIGLEDDPHHEFAYLFWSEDIQGEMIDFEVIFKEGDNTQAKIDGPYMTLVNSEGEEEELLVLKAWDMERENIVEQS